VKAKEAKTEAAGSKRFFDVLFVGPFCFKKDDRVAVMPDGRQPDDDDVQPHEPFLVVDPKDVNPDGTSGWEANDRTAKGIYAFSKCAITITKATSEGPFDATQHHETIPKAIVIDPSFEYGDNWGAGVVATIKLGQGTLEFLRRPDRRSIDQGIGTVSRLRVPHEGDVVVTLTASGEPPRVLALKPGSDVAIVNGFLDVDPSKTGNGLGVFGKITAKGTFTPGKPRVEPDVPVIGANYQVFKMHLPFVVDGIGCCPPP
jgi:hypothetical protein